MTAACLERLSFLGTGSGSGEGGRRGFSSLVVTTKMGSLIMVDCGEGTQMQMRRTLSSAPTGVSCIPALKRRRRRVVLVGPTGLKTMVSTVLSLSGSCEEELVLDFIELDPTVPHDFDLELEEEEGKGGKELLGVHASPLRHSMPALGYIFIEHEQPRELDARKAMSMGAKGKELGMLKAGQDVRLNDTVIRSGDVLLPAPQRRLLAVLQDTCGSEEALAFLQARRGEFDFPLLVHESTHEAALQELSVSWGHSTSEMAGEFAGRCGAALLVLTHFSPRYSSSFMREFLYASTCGEEEEGNCGEEDGEKGRQEGGVEGKNTRRLAEEALAAALRWKDGGGERLGVLCAEDLMSLSGRNFSEVLIDGR